MTLLRLHAPGNVASASQIVRSCPPSASIRVSLPTAVKAIDRLSGDQDGALAPSVPVSA